MDETKKSNKKNYWIVGIVVAALLVLLVSFALQSKNYEGRFIVREATERGISNPNTP